MKYGNTCSRNETITLELAPEIKNTLKGKMFLGRAMKYDGEI